MRWLFLIAIGSLAFSTTGCEVRVEEKPVPLVKPERKIDVDVDAPGVDVEIRKD